MTETVAVTNNSTRILRVALTNPKRPQSSLQVVLMPGINHVLKTDWGRCAENGQVQAWGKEGSLRHRTGQPISDRAMLQVDAKGSRKGGLVIRARQGAKPQVAEASSTA